MKRVLLFLSLSIFMSSNLHADDSWLVREKHIKKYRPAYSVGFGGKIAKPKKFKNSRKQKNTKLVVAKSGVNWNVSTYNIRGQGMVTSAVDDKGVQRWLKIHNNDSYNVYLYSKSGVFKSIVNTKLGIVAKKFYSNSYSGGDDDSDDDHDYNSRKKKRKYKNRKDHKKYSRDDDDDDDRGKGSTGSIQASVTWLYNSKPKKAVTLFNSRGQQTKSIREIKGLKELQIHERFYDSAGRYLRQMYRTATPKEKTTFKSYIRNNSY